MSNTTQDTSQEFKPFVSPSANLPELTVKSVLVGMFFGVLFGAATVYLALKAGLTVSASIPVAVLSISILKKFGKSTILENNIVQTIGSAGESIASGISFTLPALIFLHNGPHYFKYLQITTLAFVGGVIGILFMIPLRRSLIVKEHGKLPYPEGTACADVLVVGEKGGNLAKRVYQGVFVAGGYWLLMGILKLWKDIPSWTSKSSNYPNAKFDSTITPEYLGVGYIIGPRISSEMVAGGILSSWALIPLISHFLAYISEKHILCGDPSVAIAKPLYDTLSNLGYRDAWILAHSKDMPELIYRAFVRYIGMGAVTAAGIMTLIKTIPTIVSSFKDSIKGLSSKEKAATIRTEKDIPLVFVGLGVLVLVILLALLPNLPGTFPGSLLLSLLVIVFGFFFVTVASRIVGLIGVTSNPVSGMTIATILGTCLIFVMIGWKGKAYEAAALIVGSVVCIAASNAGATSQDLKTGYLIGATPYKQQIALIIGVVCSALISGWVLLEINKVPVKKDEQASERKWKPTKTAEDIKKAQCSANLKVFDDAKLAARLAESAKDGVEIADPEKNQIINMNAPQANQLVAMIKAVLSGGLPLALVIIGAMLAIMAQLAGANALSWAVGAYLPLNTTAPIFIGGMIKWLIDRKKNKSESQAAGTPGSEEVSPGMLAATGLVAGGSVMGLFVAFKDRIDFSIGSWNINLKVHEWFNYKNDESTMAEKIFDSHPWMADVVSCIPFLMLIGFLYWQAKSKEKMPKA